MNPKGYREVRLKNGAIRRVYPKPSRDEKLRTRELSQGISKRQAAILSLSSTHKKGARAVDNRRVYDYAGTIENRRGKRKLKIKID